MFVKIVGGRPLEFLVHRLHSTGGWRTILAVWTKNVTRICLKHKRFGYVPKTINGLFVSDIYKMTYAPQFNFLLVDDEINSIQRTLVFLTKENDQKFILISNYYYGRNV